MTSRADYITRARGAPMTGRRAVNAQTWRHAILKYGPKDRGIRQTLLTIGVFMGTDGRAHPNQQTIANGALISARQVQRHIAEAVRAGWIGVELSDNYRGKNWRHNVYRASVPDHVPLTRREETISEAITGTWGRIADDVQMSSPHAAC